MRTSLALILALASFGCSSAETAVNTTPDAGRPDTAVAKDSAADTYVATDSALPIEDSSEPAVDSESPVDSASDTIACDGSVCGGKCVDLRSDPANCGACGTSCGEGSCASGSCVCASGTFSCSGACVDLLTDNKNCGACGKTCATGEVCKFAACEKVCTAPTTKCFGECVDTTSSATNCGACGKTCGTGESCVGSACVCGTKLCGVYEKCVSGSCVCNKTTCGSTCTDTSSDAANCGTCGNACATGVPCVSGVCVTSTTVTFPQTTSTVYNGYSSGTTTLGSGGGTSYYVSGTYVEDRYSRTASISRLDLDIRMYDGTTTYCTVGTLTWAVKVNGTTVGTYSYVGGTSGTDQLIKQTYTFAPILPSAGQIIIRLEATTTVCSGGSSWNWYPGGTATLY